MTEISASLVKELRDATNVGMMECKRALQEANGDKDRAIQILRERGVAIAGKKAGRTAKEGLIAAEVFNDGRSAVLIEVNCETDFVARNDNFKAFVADLLEKAKACTGDLAAEVEADMVAKVTEIGENLKLGRHARFEREGEGALASYVHLGGKVGVLVELSCEKPETGKTDLCREIIKDLTLHIAACNPSYLDRTEVPADEVAAEREIYAKQVEGKPAAILEKIVEGKLNKFYSQVCLREQAFVKDGDQSVTQWLTAAGKALNDTLTISRYLRVQVGVA
ncbi:MAG: translation elongation factor Ts [Candidatus Marinimicrobia bacterium]|nr:translation elongation factor Ts [Candidatus Neomarinimicrobiota bacterium]